MHHPHNPPRQTLFTLLLVLICFAGFSPAQAQNNGRPFGDAQVLATVPTPPGFPEGIAVNGNRVYVAGPARFGTAGEPPSKVFAYDTDTGELVREYAMQGEDTTQEHANSCIAFDGAGRLYVVLAAPFASGVSILDTDGTENARLVNPAGSPIFPYDSPANAAFNKHGSLLLTNHAFATGIPTNFTVLDVFVDDKESPLVRP